MAYRSRTGGTRLRVKAASLFGLVACVLASIPPDHVAAQTKLPGYAQADDAFMHLALDERVKLQVLLTAAGYWPAVPNADFSTRLFNAILQFQVDNGFAPLGILNDQQMDRLTAIAGPYLNNWRFEVVRHPMTNSQIWVPVGLPLAEETTPTGLRFVNRPNGVVLTYDYFQEFILRASFESLYSKLQQGGTTIYYSTLYRNEFFVFSYSDGITDAYVRYRQAGRGGVGFSLYWSHAATDAHIERIATLISGSLWSSETGAPFTSPFAVKSRMPVAMMPTPSPEPQPAPSPGPPQTEPHRPSSGTGIFVTNEGLVITNAHVVKDCSEIRVGVGQGEFEIGR
jgi:serine protease Do